MICLLYFSNIVSDNNSTTTIRGLITATLPIVYYKVVSQPFSQSIDAMKEEENVYPQQTTHAAQHYSHITYKHSNIGSKATPTHR